MQLSWYVTVCPCWWCLKRCLLKEDPNWFDQNPPKVSQVRALSENTLWVPSSALSRLNHDFPHDLILLFGWWCFGSEMGLISDTPMSLRSEYYSMIFHVLLGNHPYVYDLVCKAPQYPSMSPSFRDLSHVCIYIYIFYISSSSSMCLGVPRPPSILSPCGRSWRRAFYIPRQFRRHAELGRLYLSPAP